MSVCHVCEPPLKIIIATISRDVTVTLDAQPHSAGVYALQWIDGWARATKIRRDASPGTSTRHRRHTHRKGPSCCPLDSPKATPTGSRSLSAALIDDPSTGEVP